MRACKPFQAIIVCLLVYWLPFASHSQQRPPSAFVDSALLRTTGQPINCGTDYLLKQLRKDPAFVAKEKKMNADILNALTGRVKIQGNGSGTTGDPYILPVVFHIINSASYTDQQIINALKDLNDAYGKTGAYSASAGADTRIRFVFAQKDPDGGITNGITRITSFYNDNMHMTLEDARLKNLIIWDPTKYINIWIVGNIIGELSASFSCGVWTRTGPGAYATMPPNGSLTDGIVVTGFGPMLAHEMGHYLGLYHTFEGGCTNNNCLVDGDRVCDTPPDGTTAPSPSCNMPTNSCNTDTLSNYSNGFFPRDTTDQIANFMDYNNTACSNQFTEGQASRMRAAIATQRSGLLTDVITKPCSANINAFFTRDNNNPKTGDAAVNFTNGSTGASSYQWLVNGIVVQTSQDFSYTFSSVGKYKVTLKAFDNNGCFGAYTDYVIVNCGVTARFYNNKQFIASKTNILNDTILFTNDSKGATSFQWISTDNQGQGRYSLTTNASGGGVNDLNYIFPLPGYYNIKLIATGPGGCVDSTNTLFITVADPTADAFMSLIGVNCYQDTQVRVSFYVCDFGYAPILPNLPVSFYDADPRKAGAHQVGSTFIVPDTIKGYCCGKVYTQILNVGYPKLNKLFAIANNRTTTVPITLPDPASTFPEKNDTNNIASYSNFRYTASIVPVSATMEPGDTLQLRAQSAPDPPSSFAWSPPSNLSCINCSSPFYYADTNAVTTKMLIVKSFYQCTDTAYIDIKVPTYNDFTISLNSISCAGTDSLQVNFTINNLFKRGVIPKGLLVSFYKNDPSVAGAVLAAPVFKVPDSVNAKQQTYNARIKKLNKGTITIFASVNDNGAQVPVQASSYPFAEKLYNNNTSSANYQPVSKSIDTAICSADTLFGYAVAGTYSDILTTPAGCDSIRVLKLSIKSAAVQRTNISAAICKGETYSGYTTTGTYIDVYKGVNSCDSIRTLTLTVNAVTTTNKSVQICKGSSYTAGGKSQTQSGTYIDSFKTTKGCDSILVTQLTVNSLPAKFLPADTTICIDKTLVLTLTNYVTVNWSTGSTANSITVSQAGTYGATVVDRNGCTGTDTIHVAFQKCIPIQIPSAFTPNGDYKNDIFKPLIGANVTNYRMQIFSRWGQLLFETHDYSQGWNGKFNGEVQPNGAYIYFISFTDPDGFAVNKKGTLILIR